MFHLRTKEKGQTFLLLMTPQGSSRNLVIEMVLSTDMSGHFQQIKNIRNGCSNLKGRL